MPTDSHGRVIPVKKSNSPQGWQVHYTDAAAGASNDRNGINSLVFMTAIIEKSRADPRSEMRPKQTYIQTERQQTCHEGDNKFRKMYVQPLNNLKLVC